MQDDFPLPFEPKAVEVLFCPLRKYNPAPQSEKNNVAGSRKERKRCNEIDLKWMCIKATYAV